MFLMMLKTLKTASCNRTDAYKYLHAFIIALDKTFMSAKFFCYFPSYP